MSKCIIFTLIGLLALPALAQNYKRTAITDPAISRRCEALIAQRDLKIEQKQRLVALITRNKRLQKIAPSEKQSVKKKLVKNLRHLENELRFTLVKIEHQEENIIRKGCPGITL